MIEKETEFRIIIRTIEPHRVIDRLYEVLRAVQHDVLDIPKGFIALEARTYIEEPKTVEPKE